jgi:hypothetical protein
LGPVNGFKSWDGTASWGLIYKAILEAGFNHCRRYLMNVKFYECVNERKKIQKEWIEATKN